MELVTRVNSGIFSSQLSWPGFPCYSNKQGSLPGTVCIDIELKLMDGAPFYEYYKQRADTSSEETCHIDNLPELSVSTIDNSDSLYSETAYITQQCVEKVLSKQQNSRKNYMTYPSFKDKCKKKSKKRGSSRLKAHKKTLNQKDNICNFNFSMLPRNTKSHSPSDHNEYLIFQEAYNDISFLEEKADNFLKRDTICIRPCKKNKKQKAHIQIKNKHCKDISNVYHGKKLFMHYRLYKDLVLRERIPKIKHIVIEGQVCRGEVQPVQNPLVKQQAAAPTTTQYVLQECNVASDIDNLALIAFLMEVQNRDITPEDYEQLLLLDDRIQKQTVNKHKLDAFQTECATESNIGNLCAICLDEYELGQVLKILPNCQHSFHDNCVDTWLTTEGATCPLDGLPVM